MGHDEAEEGGSGGLVALGTRRGLLLAGGGGAGDGGGDGGGVVVDGGGDGGDVADAGGPELDALVADLGLAAGPRVLRPALGAEGGLDGVAGLRVALGLPGARPPGVGAAGAVVGGAGAGDGGDGGDDEGEEDAVHLGDEEARFCLRLLQGWLSECFIYEGQGNAQWFWRSECKLEI